MTTDPFLQSDDATPADFPTRPRGRWKAPETVGLGNTEKKPRKVDFSPLQRRWFEANGYTYARVEHANAWGRVCQDLWQFADWLAVKKGEGVLLVQTCRHSDAATRARKARGRPELRVWLEAGGRFVIHGWKQPKGSGSRWHCIEREITLEALKTPANGRKALPDDPDGPGGDSRGRKG